MKINMPIPVSNVLKFLKIDVGNLIGKGGEGFVFRYSDTEVLKIYPKTTEEYLNKLSSIQKIIASKDLPFATPLIGKIGEVEGTYYSVEKKLDGVTLDSVFPSLSDSQKQEVLGNFVKTIKYLGEVHFNDHPYGQLLADGREITADTWTDFFVKKLHQRTDKSKERLEIDIKNLHEKLRVLEQLTQKYIDPKPIKSFVHGDYYLNNVLVDRDLNISAVLDISIHSVVGDHLLDVASVNFLPLCPLITQPLEDFVRGVVLNEYGSDSSIFLDIYGFYYALYFSDTHTFDQTSYDWCLGILNDETRWARYLG